MRGSTLETEENRIGPFIIQNELDDGLVSKLYRVVYQPQNALLDMGLIGMSDAMSPGSKAIVKIHKDEFKDDPSLLQSIDYESQLLTLLDHPRILRTFAKGMVDDRKWIALEDIEAVSLQRLHAHLRETEQRLSPELVLHFLFQLSDALTALHSLSLPQFAGQWIVHGGLHPTRILIDCYGSFHLLDFSFMRTIAYQPQFDFQDNQFFYQSPELVRKEQAGRQTDIYSLGLLAFELATGQSLEDGISEYEDGLSFLLAEPRLNWSEEAELPVFLKGLIARMTHPDASKRFSDAAALRTFIADREPAASANAARMAELIKPFIFV